MAIKPISVSQLNRYIGRILSTDPMLMSIAVKGELSSVTRHSSGHWYFDLKDGISSVRCFLHAARVANLRFEVDEGIEVVIYGNISVYEPRGTYSINVTDIQIEGEGALAIAFEKLKNKLAAEGLFDARYKKPLPVFPRRIGVVTSPTGAAIHDIITTIKRRSPLVDVLLYPSLVQGPGAAATICEGIRVLNEVFPDLDLMIVGRGGGSAEELWTFNEESVARAIFDSKIPVISAVGHEVDYVISDLVADLRAPTPTAAAELAVPHIDNIRDRIRLCSPQRNFGSMEELIESNARKCRQLMDSAVYAESSILENASARLRIAGIDLKSLDPMGILTRGYAVVKNEEGKWVSSISEISNGSRISIRFANGQAIAEVLSTEVDNG